MVAMNGGVTRVTLWLLVAGSEDHGHRPSGTNNISVCYVVRTGQIYTIT